MKRVRPNTSRRSRGHTGGRSLRPLLLRRPGLALVVVLLALGAVALERRNMLPEPAAVVVRQVERWLAPLLEEIGINVPGPGAPGSSEPGEPRTAEGGQAAAVQTLRLLDRITVEPERPRGYEREDWPHWLDADGDCVDARQEVLASESKGTVTWDRDGCDVESGQWRDAYTGEVWRDPRDLDVDHMVPLAEAHRSGG